jgi:hypothetical protein
MGEAHGKKVPAVLATLEGLNILRTDIQPFQGCLFGVLSRPRVATRGYSHSSHIRLITTNLFTSN